MLDRRVYDLTERYTKQARDYRELWAPVLHGPCCRLLDELEAVGAKRVIDVGTGVGTLLPVLRSRFPGARVVGVDRSRGMVAQAGKERLVVMDAAAVAFAAATFDVAVLAFVLFHLPDPVAGLREVRRVLRPRGILGITTWSTDFESKATRVWDEELERHGAAPLDADAGFAQHELMDSPQKLSQLVRQAGFRHLRTWAAALEYDLDAEHLIALRTRVGRQKHRFDALESSAKGACLASARRRLAALEPSDFVARGEIVYAVARASE